MSDVSKTNELITEAREAAVRSALWDIPHLLFRLADALEATTGVRVGMSSAVGVETQLADRVPVQGEPNDDREALRDEFRSYLGDEVYVCSRDHSAWSHGTMGLDDFSLASDDDEIVESLVEIASRTVVPDAATTRATGKPVCACGGRDAAATAKATEKPVPDAATAAVERVRAIHYNEHGECTTCSDEYGPRRWPCPTVAALDGAPEPEVHP